VRAQNLGVDFTVLSQGVPFFHAGVDLLRSKSMDRDSFNSGDWFNRLDFTYQDNNWAVGLPVASKNESNWPIIGPLLADPALRPEPEHIADAAAHLREMLALRGSSELFRLTTADDVMSRVAFHNTGPSQIPGLIVMSISDTVGTDLDPDADGMVVLFNATDDPVVFPMAALAGEDVILHPIQAGSVDDVVTTASFDEATGTFSIPARTTAVFIHLEPDTTPPEVTAELVPIRVWPRIGRFEVSFSCVDDRDPNPVATATLNGIPVDNGDRVFLITTRELEKARMIRGTLFVWAPEFELVVTCTDEAGNTATVTVTPEFRGALLR
jgi:hypothetical protein